MKMLSVVLTAMLLLSAMLVFADTAAAGSKVRVEGQITDTSSNGVSGLNVEIERYYKTYTEQWVSLGTNITNATGGYNIPSSGYKEVYPGRAGTYRLKIGGTVVETKELTKDDWSKEMLGCNTRWVCVWNYQIPEFTTIAIPIVAILGLVAFYRRKQKK